MATIWVVPGAPLERGLGWRIWYCWPGGGDFTPAAPTVARGDNPEPIETEWTPSPVVKDVGRRMGILTVRLVKPDPGLEFDVTIPEAGVRRPFVWKTLSDTLVAEDSTSGALRTPVSFLLSSCFWRGNDKDGRFSSAVEKIAKDLKPSFKLLAGDQVYQDWPSTLVSFRSPVGQYAARYEEYWGDDKYRALLQACPNYFMCDDHEFWNDFPESQIHLERTWTEGSRRAYGRAALDTYEHYQRRCNPGRNRWYTIRVGRVHFFVADTRSERTPVKDKMPHFFSEGQWADLEAWAKGLVGPGVLVLGQPLYQADGDFKDHSLSNFPADYGRLCALIRDTISTGFMGGQRHDILMLSGDIHTGRFCARSVLDGRGNAFEVPELIGSASSRIIPASAEAEWAPRKFSAPDPGGGQITWTDQEPSQDQGIIDDNVAAVNMSEGTAGRVRFELAIWRVRPVDSRGYWARTLDLQRPDGPVVKVFEKIRELF